MVVKCVDKVKEYFRAKSKSKLYFFDVDDLELDPENEKLGQIRKVVRAEVE